MTTGTILAYAIVVFGLMVAGLFFTMQEFLRISDDPAKKKGLDREQEQTSAREAPTNR